MPINRTVRSIILLACILSLAACTPAPTPAPTIDPGPIQTRAAANVFATMTAAVTATFTPSPTATATNTPEPTATATNTPEPTATLGTPVPSPTEPIIGDGAKFLTTAPPQYSEFPCNQTFNVEFDLLNVGTTTWTMNYYLVRVGGEPFTVQTVIPLTFEVPPGKKGVFIFGAFASEVMTPHTTVWQLYNSKGLPVPGGLVWFTYKPV